MDDWIGDAVGVGEAVNGGKSWAAVGIAVGAGVELGVGARVGVAVGIGVAVVGVDTTTTICCLPEHIENTPVMIAATITANAPMRAALIPTLIFLNRSASAPKFGMVEAFYPYVQPNANPHTNPATLLNPADLASALSYREPICINSSSRNRIVEA